MTQIKIITLGSETGPTGPCTKWTVLHILSGGALCALLGRKRRELVLKHGILVGKEQGSVFRTALAVAAAHETAPELLLGTGVVFGPLSRGCLLLLLARRRSLRSLRCRRRGGRQGRRWGRRP
jgi:hypothetical protein